MCSKFHFNGNVLTPKNSNGDLARTITKLQLHFFESIHPPDEIQIIDRLPASAVAVKARELHAQAMSEFRKMFKSEIEPRSGDIIRLVRLAGCDYSRTGTIPWHDPKTDKEIYGHILRHMNPESLFGGVGVPLYDVSALAEVGAQLALIYVSGSIANLVRCELRAAEETGFFSDFAVYNIEALLRTLRFIDGYVPGVFPHYLSGISVSLDQPLILTQMEAAELEAFKRHVRENGPPNIELTYGVARASADLVI